eukprot:COSAG06_NODE_1821_length_8290_cov_33.022586_3_plen_152_part_00
MLRLNALPRSSSQSLEGAISLSPRPGHIASCQLCSAPVGTCFGFVAAQFLFFRATLPQCASTSSARRWTTTRDRSDAGSHPRGRRWCASPRAPRAVLQLSASALPPFIPTRRPLTGCCGARATQIELLGYSGQFDYPEFLAEVRARAPSAL